MFGRGRKQPKLVFYSGDNTKITLEAQMEALTQGMPTPFDTWKHTTEAPYSLIDDVRARGPLRIAVVLQPLRMWTATDLQKITEVRRSNVGILLADTSGTPAGPATPHYYTCVSNTRPGFRYAWIGGGKPAQQNCHAFHTALQALLGTLG